MEPESQIPKARITVTDIDIPFTRLVVIFINWGLAAIPATIIMSFLVAIIISVFTAVFAGAFTGLGIMMGGFAPRL